MYITLFTRSLSPVISQHFHQIRTVGAQNDYVTTSVIAVVSAHYSFRILYICRIIPTTHVVFISLPTSPRFFDQRIQNVPSVCNIFMSVTPDVLHICMITLQPHSLQHPPPCVCCVRTGVCWEQEVDGVVAVAPPPRVLEEPDTISFVLDTHTPAQYRDWL